MTSSLAALVEEADSALVRRAQRGDPAAFGRLCDRHAALLRKVCARCLSGAGQPEDVVQEVFLEAWRKVRTYDPERGPVRSWLITLARSRAIDARRAAGRRPTMASPQDTIEDVGDEATLERQIEARRAMARLASLRKEYREALLLTYYSGYTMAEAAEAIAVPVGTMKARVHRAVAQLRTQLKEDSHDDL